MSRHRLGLVLTGGTIGSTAAEDAEVVQLVRANPVAVLPGWLAGPLAAFGPHQLSIRQPVSFHSEEARPADWTAIAESCRALADRGTDAICILHGSDTMAYTAAALAFALSDLDIPIVLTGSNVPPDAESSDARNNVRSALVALRSLPAGVYVVFAGSERGDALVHLGTRVRKERASGTAFVSPNGGPVAIVSGGRMRALVPWSAPQPVVPLRTTADFVSEVLELRVHPGLPFAALEAAVAAGGVRGVVAELYPCATGPTGDDDTSLERFARFVSDRGGVVVATVAAAPEVAGSYYPSLPTLTDAGVTFLPGVLSSAATVKLMWALARTDGDPDATRRLMRRPVAGEIALVGRTPPSPRPTHISTIGG